jgi:hypothetical protein
MPDPGNIKIFVRSLDRGQFSYELSPNVCTVSIFYLFLYNLDLFLLLSRAIITNLTIFPIFLILQSTVGGLKDKVAADIDSQTDRLRLLYHGRELTEDSQTLGQFNFPENVVLHCALRVAPTSQQRRAPATAGAAAGGVPPEVAAMFPPGGQGGPVLVPANMMELLQGGGGLAGLLGGGGAGPTGVNISSIERAVTQMFGNSATVDVRGPDGTRIGGNGPGRGGGGNAGQINTANNNSNNSYFPGAIPFMYPFGPTGRIVPGLSSETAPRGGDPILDANGRYTETPVFEGLDQLLLRLQNGNMVPDNGPALYLATRDRIALGNSTNAWAQAARAFLRSCHTILCNANLNRETLAALNRIFAAVGLSPLQLGVRSFPIADDNSDGESSDGGAAAAPAREVRTTRRSRRSRRAAINSDSDALPELIDSDDAGSSGSGSGSSDGNESSPASGSYVPSLIGGDTSNEDSDGIPPLLGSDTGSDSGSDDEEEDRDEEHREYVRHRATMYALYGSDYTSNEHDSDEDDDDWYSEDEEDEDVWTTDDGEAEAVPAAVAGRNARAGGSDSDESGNSSPPPLVSAPDEEEPQTRAARASTTRGGRTGGGGRGAQQASGRGRTSASAARPAAAANSDRDASIPELLSDDGSGSSNSENVRRNARQRTAAAAQQTATGTAGGRSGRRRRQEGGGHSSRSQREDPAWFREMPDDDLILVAAVTIGELARRFMSVLGQENAPVQANAMIMRLATRLRSLSSLEGIGRQEIAVSRITVYSNKNMLFF